MARTFRSVYAPKGITLDYIEITSMPDKVLYIVGESVDTAGLIVTAHADLLYGNVTSDCTITPQTITNNTQEITISYGNKIISYNIYIMDSILVTTPPDKVVYNIGDELDLTGIEVTGYSGTLTRDVTNDCTFSPSSGTTLDTEGNFNITVTFGSLTTSISYKVGRPVEIVPFATATEEQIREMLDAHYNNEIDLHNAEGWEVGATRNITYKQVPSMTVSSLTYPQQASFSGQLVIVHKGGMPLETPVNGHTECAFTIAMKQCFNTSVKISSSKSGCVDWIHSGSFILSYAYIGNWITPVKLDNIFGTRNAVKDTVFDFYADEGDVGRVRRVTYHTYQDEFYTAYHFIPSEYQYTGATTNSNSTAAANENKDVQFDYYKTATNRKKKYGTNSNFGNHWTRTQSNTAGSFVYINTKGESAKMAANSSAYVDVHFCL